MRRLMGLALLSLSFAAAVGLAQEGGDMQAQILYAYQSEDTNLLASLVQNLANQVKAGGADAALRYHLAHAEYRFGLLVQGKRAGEAAPAFSDCVEQLKSILAQDVKSAEALVLQSACYGELAKRRRLEAVLLRSKADERLNAAFKLEPRNPRVLYFVAEERTLALEAGLAGKGAGVRRASGIGEDLRSVVGDSRTMCRAGDTRKRISRSAYSCRSAAIRWEPATGSRSR